MTSEQTTTPTEVLTFEETRARIRVGRSTMFRLMKDDELPHFKIGSSLRFLGEDVEQFLRDKRQGGPTPA